VRADFGVLLPGDAGHGRKFDVRFSITALQDKRIREAVQAISDAAWTPEVRGRVDGRATAVFGPQPLIADRDPGVALPAQELGHLPDPGPCSIIVARSAPQAIAGRAILGTVGGGVATAWCRDVA
jgi:hypothetical protein